MRLKRIIKECQVSRRARANVLAEVGAAALELAMMAPLIILLCAVIFDVGTYFGYVGKVDKIATGAAMYVMDHSSETPTSSTLTNNLASQFPELATKDGSFKLKVNTLGESTEELNYPIYVAGELKRLNTNIGSKKYSITVETTQSWPALGFLFKDTDGKFSVSLTRLCDGDKLHDSKWK